MKMKYVTAACVLATVAGSISTSALAQTDTLPGYVARVAPMPVGYQGSVYNNRVNQLVYSTAAAGTGFAGSGGARIAYDDFDCTPGPGSNIAGLSINGIGFAVTIPAGTGTLTPTVRLSFYDTHNPAVTPAVPCTNPYGTLLGSVSYNLSLPQDPTSGIIYFYPAPLAVAPAIPLLDDNGGILMEVFSDATMTTYDPVTQPGGRTGANASPGSTLPGRYFDANNDFCLGGDEGPGGTTAANNVARSIYYIVQADVPPPPIPTPNTNVGALADTGAQRCGDNTAAGVDWYRVTLNGDATDVARQFLDIDTEGSATDVAIGIYSTAAATQGAFAGVSADQSHDDDDGSGTNAQMSFGIGRRAAVVDGRQYDGRNGQLAAGEYIVAVAPAGSAFGPGFTVAPSAGARGAYCLNFATNTNGTALAPSVAPIADYDAGVIMAPGGQGVGVGPLGYEVSWYTFQVPCAISAGGTKYLDIDFNQSLALADPMAAIFDSNGNVIAVSDDAATGYDNPQFSFGNVGPRPGIAGNTANPPAFAGEFGALPAGTYYMAMSLYQLLGTNDRWHARSNSGSSLTIQANFYSNEDGVCAASCHGDCVADFDDGSGTGTPDQGVTIDDLLYYLGIFEAGVLCADVDDGSGTGTQDQGVTIDDLLYYLFRFEAGC